MAASAEERLRRILSHVSVAAVGATLPSSSSSTCTTTATRSQQQQEEEANCLMDACGTAAQPRSMSRSTSQESSATEVNPGHCSTSKSSSSSSSCSQASSRMDDAVAHANAAAEEFLQDGPNGIADFSKPQQQQQQLGTGTGAISLNRASASWPVDRGCIFCKIIHGYEHAFKLYEDDFCICILDINPLCYGHSLLVPKGHFPSLDVTPPQVAAAMCSVVPLISNVIMEATSCDAFNLVVNSGEAAGQVVFHTHFHIVPRFAGDGLWTNESVNRKTLSTFKDPAQLMHAVHSKLASRR